MEEVWLDLISGALCVASGRSNILEILCGKSSCLSALFFGRFQRRKCGIVSPIASPFARDCRAIVFLEGSTAMEMFLHAILSDLLGRSVSLLVQRYRQQSSVEGSLEKLQLALLRVHATVEEAEGRHITNQAMLKQLGVLRKGMYRGYYMLDTFTYRAHRGEAPCRSSFALSRFNPAKCLCFPAGNAQGVVLGVESTAELRRMVDSLGSMIADMKEFVTFLKWYPRICRQPYSMCLLLDKFMFGRQKEMEQIINFLLQAEANGNGLGVLPIVGIARVGKSTLVEHVCHDERVRSHFSSIIFREWR